MPRETATRVASEALEDLAGCVDEVLAVGDLGFEHEEERVEPALFLRGFDQLEDLVGKVGRR